MSGERGSNTQIPDPREGASQQGQAPIFEGLEKPTHPIVFRPEEAAKIRRDAIEQSTRREKT